VADLPPDSSSGEGDYNFIYTKLVQNETDVIGVVAYSVYKRQKIEYIEAIRSKHQRRPDERELASFHDLTNSATQLDSYRQQAVALVRVFLKSAISEEAVQLSQRYEERTKQELARFRPRFWTGVAQSVIGSAGFVMVLGALVIFTWSLNQGPRQVIEQVFDVTITTNAASSAVSEIAEAG
jgi:hypothetical protein